MSVPPIARLFRACEPNVAIGPDDPRYVNFDEVRGDNVVMELSRTIRLSGDECSKCYLFPGHRGVGKTSELYRLRHLLERPDSLGPAFQTIMFDVQQALDVNDLDFPDLLVFVAAEAQTQLKQAGIPGFSATNTLLKRWWDDIYGLLGSEVSIPKADVDVGFGKLAVEIKNQPTARAK